MIIGYMHEMELHKAVDSNGSPKTIVTPEDLVNHVPGWRELLKKAEIVRKKHFDDVLDPVFLLTYRLDDNSCLKEQFSVLLGWKSKSPEPWVRSSCAYNVGYKALLQVLLP